MLQHWQSEFWVTQDSAFRLIVKSKSVILPSTATALIRLHHSDGSSHMGGGGSAGVSSANPPPKQHKQWRRDGETHETKCSLTPRRRHKPHSASEFCCSEGRNKKAKHLSGVSTAYLHLQLRQCVCVSETQRACV